MQFETPSIEEMKEMATKNETTLRSIIHSTVLAIEKKVLTMASKKELDSTNSTN